ncbi:MAG: protein translocase SEC61 complex subunit gamma [Nanoarchaeota archaeon]|nr:protein translocase SEC61 complex subunit gamma [Nanoarchaeota archaeon]
MTLTENIKNFIAKSKRVWLVLKKPSKNEYTTIAKVSAIGILILGVLGFLISIIMKSFI